MFCSYLCLDCITNMSSAGITFWRRWCFLQFIYFYLLWSAYFGVKPDVFVVVLLHKLSLYFSWFCILCSYRVPLFIRCCIFVQPSFQSTKNVKIKHIHIVVYSLNIFTNRDKHLFTLWIALHIHICHFSTYLFYYNENKLKSIVL